MIRWAGSGRTGEETVRALGQRPHVCHRLGGVEAFDGADDPEHHEEHREEASIDFDTREMTVDGPVDAGDHRVVPRHPEEESTEIVELRPRPPETPDRVTPAGHQIEE